MPSLKTIIVVGAGEYIASEDSPSRSRDQILLAATTVALPAGTILGQSRGAQSVSSAARAGNTGNGTLSAVTAATTNMPGRYSITMTSATAFVVEDSQGEQVGAGVAGTTFTKGGISFLLTAGGTAFVANDGFDITVAYAAGGTYAPVLETATDGSQNASAILFEGRPVSSGTQRAVISSRAMEYNANKVFYVDRTTGLARALSATQLAAFEAQLKALGIIPRY